MIAEIISGQFTGTPESYAIQMTYGFTWLLSKLYLLTRSLNWYAIALIFMQILSFGAVLYRLQSFAKDWKKKLLVVVGILQIRKAVRPRVVGLYVSRNCGGEICTLRAVLSLPCLFENHNNSLVVS